MKTPFQKWFFIDEVSVAEAAFSYDVPTLPHWHHFQSTSEIKGLNELKG